MIIFISYKIYVCDLLISQISRSLFNLKLVLIVCFEKYIIYFLLNIDVKYWYENIFCITYNVSYSVLLITTYRLITTTQL